MIIHNRGKKRIYVTTQRPERIAHPIKPKPKYQYHHIAIGVALVCALVFPLLLSNPAVTSIAVFTLLFMSVAMSWNLFSGYTGYISLGSGAFSGLGAYTLALLCRVWNVPGGYVPFLLLPLVGLIVGGIAVPLGWFFLRVRGYPFVILTIALSLLFQQLANNFPDITGGSAGALLPFAPWNGYVYNLPFYYVALLLVVLTFAISWRLRYSKYGLGLLAIRDDEERVRGMGKNTETLKLGAFSISAALQGIAGAVLVYFIGSINPQTAFDPVANLLPALMVFLGGMGTLTGPLVGALLLAPLQQSLTLLLGTTGLDLILFSILMLAILFWLPEGIVPGLSHRWVRWKKVLKDMVSRSAPSHPALRKWNDHLSVDQQRTPVVRRRTIKYGGRR